MLVLVLANNYLVLFVGWELVGLSSYLLIGFWYQKRDIFEDVKGFFRKDVPFEAAKKAFIVNRIGDFGFTLGIMMLFANFGTLAFADVFNKAPTQAHNFILGNMTVICLLLFMGAMGKSAQFPLHVWLPDAMEGPTPVSALIHAATMVTAGVYLVARSNPLFHHAPRRDARRADYRHDDGAARGDYRLHQPPTSSASWPTRRSASWAICSRAWAWAPGSRPSSTCSRTPSSRALLFLGSGSSHARHARPGSRRQRRPGHPQDGRAAQVSCRSTAITFIIGALANAGVFPFAGFWSKDEIIGGRHQQRLPGGAGWRAALGRLVPDRVLYVPAGLPGLLQRAALGSGTVHPHEIAVGDDGAAGHPGRRGGPGRLPRASRRRTACSTSTWSRCSAMC